MNGVVSQPKPSNRAISQQKRVKKNCLTSGTAEIFKNRRDSGRKSDIRVVIYNFGCEMKNGISIVIYRIKERERKSIS